QADAVARTRRVVGVEVHVVEVPEEASAGLELVTGRGGREEAVVERPALVGDVEVRGEARVLPRDALDEVLRGEVGHGDAGDRNREMAPAGAVGLAGAAVPKDAG